MEPPRQVDFWVCGGKVVSRNARSGKSRNAGPQASVVESIKRFLRDAKNS